MYVQLTFPNKRDRLFSVVNPDTVGFFVKVGFLVKIRSRSPGE